MIRFYYLDWRPRACNASLDIAQEETITLSENFYYNDDHSERDVPGNCYCRAQIVPYWMRSDGLFVFSIEWETSQNSDGSNLMPFDAYRIAVATEVADLIKKNSGHVHFFNYSMSKFQSEKFPTLTSNSIELFFEEIDFDRDPKIDIRDIVTNPQKLLKLKAARLMGEPENKPFMPGGIDGEEDEQNGMFNAVLLLRSQYSKLFDKALEVREEIRDARIGKRFWKKGIKAYSYLNVLYLTVLMAMAFTSISFFSNLTTLSSDGKLEAVFYSQKFFTDLWARFSLIMIPASFAVMFVEVYLKRRKIINVFEKIKGYLLYGTILNSVVESIHRRAYPDIDVNLSGFDDSVQILNHIQREEERGSARVLVICSVILLASIFVDSSTFCALQSQIDVDFSFTFGLVEFNCDRG